MTTEEIYEEIIAEKESGNYPELDELNSTSKVAIWRLWVYIFSFFSKTIRELFEGFKIWVEDFFSRNQIGTLNWWLSELFKFQYGDEIEFIDGKFKYAVIDETKQITKQAAIEIQNRILLVKVAKDDGSGNLTAFAPAEKTAIEGYIHKIKLPGTFIQVISQDAALLNINYKIYYNSEITEAEITANVEEAINDYLINIVFNAEFSPTKLTDELQKIQGINNPVFQSAEAKEQFSTEWITINDYYTAISGYMTLNTLTIQFIAN